jgi:Fur family ferric uptake transcriptional regulator
MALTNSDGTTSLPDNTASIKQRTTKQRTAIAAELAQTKDFISAQDLHLQLKHSGQVIGLSTVYRALATMSELNEVDVILREDGEALYRSCSQNHHHHIVCTKCGNTNEITAEFVEAWAHDVASAHGFSDVTHTLEIMGVCSHCTS